MLFCVQEKCLIKFVAQPCAVFVLSSFLSFPSSAQQTPPVGPAPSTTQTDSSSKPAAAQQQKTPDSDKDQSKDAQSTSGQGKVEGTSNDRLFYTLPNFLTLQSKSQLPPMSTKDKFNVAALGTFDYVEYPLRDHGRRQHG